MQPLKFLSEMFEILDEDIAQTQVTDRRYGGKMNFKGDWRQKKGELGRGLFSKVVPDKNDPHMVQKRTTSPMGPDHPVKADGFEQYVRMLVDNDFMDNIHFPKVYKANTTTDNTDTHRSTYTIERLADISTISEEEFQALAERCLSRPVYDVKGLADRIGTACESEYGRKTYIKMETLYEACELIEAMDKVSDFRLDLHEGNLMVRRTPHGLQLVISDPFGMVKNSAISKYDGSQPQAH